MRFPEGRYEGEVDDKKIPNGQGCLEFPGNDEMERQSYEGDFVDKKAHGKGVMRWRQGDKYDGDWENGLRHGVGNYISKVWSGADFTADNTCAAYFHAPMPSRKAEPSTMANMKMI